MTQYSNASFDADFDISSSNIWLTARFDNRAVLSPRMLKFERFNLSKMTIDSVSLKARSIVLP